MATPLINPRNIYIGNDSATEFAISFPYSDRSQVHVYLKRYDSEETELSTDDYSFVSDSVVKFPKEGSSEAVLRTNDKLAIQRETPIESDYVFNNQKRLFPEDVMDADDLAFRILQEQNAKLDRTLSLNATSTADPSEVIMQVERVYSDLDSIDDVADNIADVRKVAEVADDLSDVVAIASDIASVVEIKDSVTTVAGDKTNIDAVAGNKSNIDTVADNTLNINSVAGNISNINAVNANKTNIDAVAADINDVNTVANNVANIDSVADNMSDVSAVATNISNVNTVASNASNINTVVNNMASIVAAPTYADNANIWAEGTDEQVQALGGIHSSKTWASFGKYYVGQIVESPLPIADASLHLLDGNLILGGGIYSAFVTYIAGLVSTYPDCFTTEANWQSAVATYGVCGKFVYDSVNNTVRLPKITGIVEGTTDLTALGDLVEAGLPNITGSFTNENNGTVGATGAFYKTSGDRKDGRSGNDNYNDWYYFDASRSNSIYGNSTTVQPQTIKVLYYIVVATSTKTEIEVDIDEIVTDLNGKADKDLSNITPTQDVKSEITSWGMPSNTYIDKTLTTGTYTAEANGYVVVEVSSSTYVTINSGSFNNTSNRSNNGSLKVFLPIRKGASYTITATQSALSLHRFIYAEGEI